MCRRWPSRAIRDSTSRTIWLCWRQQGSPGRSRQCWNAKCRLRSGSLMSSSSYAPWTRRRTSSSAPRPARGSMPIELLRRKSWRLPACASIEECAMASNGTTRVVMLGTGTPRPDPNRSGPATAIVVGDTPYLIDFGTGVIRRATAAYQSGVTALGFGGVNIKTAFLTHLHSDHTIGYPDLIFTPWVMGRNEPIDVYGPKGIASMTDNILKAWQVDINGRAGGIGDHDPAGCKVNTHEISPGVVYKD